MSNVKIILVGDSAEGLKQAPLGMWYAKKMRADGGKHGLVRSFVPAEGVLFRVLLDDYTGDKCYIEAGTAPCPLIQYSGYLDTAGAYDTKNMFGVRKVPAYNPGTDPAPTLPPDTPLGSDQFPRVAVPVQANYSEFDIFFKAHKPTRYTGLMRKVLQCTFATATWIDSLCYKALDIDLVLGTYYRFKLDYKWNNSWGVVLAPGTDGSKGSHYFLIQIILNTVQWVKADFCVHKVKVDGADSYAPVLKAIHQTQTVILGTLPSLGGSSCSPVVGWSFSYTQPKASVVIYGSVDQGTQSFYTTRIAEIEIMFAKNVPDTVKTQIGEPQIVWTHKLTNDDSIFSFGDGVCNVPQVLLDGVTVVIVTQDWHPIRSAAPSNYNNIRTPIHVYYSPDGSRHLVEYIYQTTAAVSDVQPAWTSAADALGRRTGTTTRTATITWGFLYDGVGVAQAVGTANDSYSTYEIGNQKGRFVSAWDIPSGYSGAWGLSGPESAWNIRIQQPSYWVVDSPGPPEVGHMVTPAPFNSAPTEWVYPYKSHQPYWVVGKNITESGGETTVASTCTFLVDDVEAIILHHSKRVAGRTYGENKFDAWTTKLGEGSKGYWNHGAFVATENFDSGAAINDVAVRLGGAGSTGTSDGGTYYNSIYGIAPPFDGGWYKNGGWYPEWRDGDFAYGFPYVAGGDVVTNTSTTEVGTRDIKLYSHHDPIVLDEAAWWHVLSMVHYDIELFKVGHSSAAFSPKKYYSYDKQVNKQVVVMGGQEYNQTNAVTGWIGVV